MQYREYGKTGKKVSVVGMGGMRFRQADYGDGNLDRCAAVVHRAFERGINYFDTAPGYCDDKSEAIFGRAFQTMPRDRFYVSTKVALWHGQTGSDARRMLEQSLRILGLEQIDFYNCWCVKTMEEYAAYMKKGGVYEAMQKAKEEGLIHHICFTTHLSGEDIAKVVADGAFEGVTLGYNAVNFAYRQKGVEAAAKAGMGIVTMNPLGGGLIPTHPDKFGFLRREPDSLVVSALKFITSQPYITVALAAGSSPEEEEENVLAGENLYHMSPAYLQDMARNLTEELNALCTGCRYCDECPAGVNIPALMDGYNEYVLSGNPKSIGEKLASFWSMSPAAAQACLSCGHCETLCTQKLPIVQRLQFVARQAGEK